MTAAVLPSLHLEKVCRLFPQDIADTPMAMLGEMLLPVGLRKRAHADEFFALRDIGFSLQGQQKLGVIGGHRSGKSVLAGIAAGILSPTSGRVTASGCRLLVSRPTAGFKPTLTVMENLTFRAAMGGLKGESLLQAIYITLERCGVSVAEARKPVGNLSPYVIRHLAMNLLLELPADILVIDETTGAGAGEARWQTRALLQDRIQSCSALVVSNDFAFLEDATDRAILLHQGRMYGPFPTRQALEYFEQLPNEYSIANAAEYDPLCPPIDDDGHHAGLAEVDSELIEDAEQVQLSEALSNLDDRYEDDVTRKRELKQQWGSAATLVGIYADGQEYERSKLALLKTSNELLEICAIMIFSRDVVCYGVEISLYSGYGMKVGSETLGFEKILLKKGEKLSVTTKFKIPSLPKDHYGVALNLVEDGGFVRGQNLMKVLIYGLLTYVKKEASIKLNVVTYSVDKLDSNQETK